MNIQRNPMSCTVITFIPVVTGSISAGFRAQASSLTQLLLLFNLTFLAVLVAPSAFAGGVRAGAVYTAGENVEAIVPNDPEREAVAWRALDDRLNEVARGAISSSPTGIVPLGRLGIGWYRVEFLDKDGKLLRWTTTAVLAPVAFPPPADSPICADAAISWFAKNDPVKQERFAQLAARAGLCWVRDRITWGELQTAPGAFAGPTQYDEADRIQAGKGLKVLQVFHMLPPWAGDAGSESGHVVPDLRRVYEFTKAMAVRFKGRVSAWEPWNEANIGSFGGMTADAMCSLQKAAYLGFKAGDSSVTVGWNPIGGINGPALVKTILDNETWPYYDTYNIHSYDWPDAYPQLWLGAREAACGRPMWVTECDRGIATDKESPVGDMTHENDLRKAEFMAQSYAMSLYSGSDRHFHFILGQYMEQNGGIQFGLLRNDLTPRPSYVALAAVARLLPGAHCLGRWLIDGQPHAYVIAFRAKPNGVAKDLLVAWTEKPGDWAQRGAAHLDWSLPTGIKVEQVYDYLGRSCGSDLPKQLSSSPLFVVMASGEAEKLPLQTIGRAPFRGGVPSPIVLQLQTPDRPPVTVKKDWTEEQYHTAQPGAETELEIVAYNFSEKPAKGTIVCERLPQGWKVTPDRSEVSISPMDRVRLKCTVVSAPSDADTTLVFRGDFGKQGTPVLVFELRPLALN